MPRNLLALYYGIYFYNRISGYALFDQTDPPLVGIEDDPNQGHSVYTWNGLVHINLHACLKEDEFLHHPITTVHIYEEPSVTAPSYITNILIGLEEASHLHLDLLHKVHSPDYWNHSDHRSPKRLWENSDDDPLSYRAKLWHEFAALTIQWVYLNHYVIAEFPDTVAEFNYFYSRAKKMRAKWVKRKLKGLTTQTNFV